MIVGFVGFMGSGKGTAGDIISDELGFNKESFAKPVKDVTSILFGWPRDLLEGDTDESRRFREAPHPYWSRKFDRPFTPREAMQKVGTEAVRDVFDKNFWVHSMERRINPISDYVITDVRFDNEINWIIEQGGTVIEVQRGQNPYWYNYLKENGNEKDRQAFMSDYNIHFSEWAWIRPDVNMQHLIKNDGSKEEFRQTVLKLLTPPDLYDRIINQHNGVLQ